MESQSDKVRAYRASVHAAVSFRVGSQVVPSGSQRYAGQQSSTAVPIHSSPFRA